MAFDGMMVYAISKELQDKLKSGRITKIYQPYERDLVFHIRAGGRNHKLFMSANPTYPRLHLTTERFVNPEQAPMFCMLLRKHFEGGFITNIAQESTERVVYVDIRSKNELGDTVYKRLVVEIMGRHSNILLIDPEQNMILDSIHHVSQAVNQHRAILPGRPYVKPPEQNKFNPFTADTDTVMRKLNFNAGHLDRQIIDNFSGISPLLAKEIIHRAGLAGREALAESFVDLIRRIYDLRIEPTIMDTEQKEYFYLFSLNHIAAGQKQNDMRKTTFDTVSDMLQSFFQGKADRDRLKQRAHDIIRFVSNEKKKNEKKITKLEYTLEESERAGDCKLFGELLTAFMHQVKPGDKQLEAPNYYDENGGTVTIPLDPTLSPNENAQRFFKRYNKLKTSKKEARKQIRLAEQEVDYFDGLLQQLEQATVKDVREIREELAEGGYLKNRSKKTAKKKKDDRPQLETFYSSEGVQILVGKNNKQNEYVTNRLARSHDTWLHTKDIPGSHVVIRGQNISEQTLMEAAEIAAYYSKAKHSSQVPVDYTLIKHVRKPSGAKPGFVIYDHQQTVYVTPRREAVESRRQKPEAASS